MVDKHMSEKLRTLLKGNNKGYLVALAGVGVLLLLVYNTLLDTEEAVDQVYVRANNMSEQRPQSFTTQIETRLEGIFSSISGVGEVNVMVTLTQGSELVVATEISQTNSSTIENDGAGGTREVTNMSHNMNYVSVGNSPLILTEIEPRVEGVIVVAQGGGNIRVVEAITNAVRAVLGIEAHRIVVLEMGE